VKFSKEIHVGNKIISEDSSVFIIAEAGVNHGGDIQVAKQLIDIAVDAGADAVKFQAFKTEHLILKDVDKAPYQKKKPLISQNLSLKC
jgi:sialic acid synthase SpsE